MVETGVSQSIAIKRVNNVRKNFNRCYRLSFWLCDSVFCIFLGDDMKVGDIVRIAPEWRDDPNDSQAYEVIEWTGDRGFISPVIWRWEIRPTELVTFEMIA